MTSRTAMECLIPSALITLSLVPVVVGVSRLIGLAPGSDATPDNTRFLVFSLPAVLHMVGASLFCVLGASQFAPGLR